MEEIFNNSFLEYSAEKIINEINQNGFFFFEEAIKKDFVQKIENDLSQKEFGVNDNFATPVWTRKQYYFTHAMTKSKSYFDLITSKKYLSIAKTKFNKDFRLKCHRYYETSHGHHMTWHADNIDNTGKIHENEGLIFIAYVNDVFDGEFQLIEGTNLKNDQNERELNYNSDKFVEEHFSGRIKSFKGKAGSVVIYDTWHLHRAKPIIDKNFTRKSIFMQIDESMRNSEKILITPEFFSQENYKNEELMKYLGFGEKSDFPSDPNATYKNLPPRKMLNLISKLLISTIKNTIKMCLLKIFSHDQVLKFIGKKKDK